jgi:hypothetical protein
VTVNWLVKACLALWLRCRSRWRKIFRTRPMAGSPSTRVGKSCLPHFLEGANLPWLRYGGDFGANAWDSNGGMGQAQHREALRRHFLELEGRGLHAIRWFLLCDGRAGIRFSAAGTPIGPDPFLYRDIDAALETAAAAGLMIIFVLLDFLWFGKAARINGVQVRGRDATVTGAYKQRALRRRVIRPILKRYGHSPIILAWDIVNEPEWVTHGCGSILSGGAVPFLTMRRFIRKTVRLVHRCTGQLATVGLANAAGLPLVRDVGLDFYQVHWYDRWESLAPLERPVPDLDLDRPLLLGEFPTRNSSRSPDSIVAAARSSGYCGALGWSVLGSDRSSGIDLESEMPPG